MAEEIRPDSGIKAPFPDPHLARHAGQLEMFLESFIEEIDDVLIQPEWFNTSRKNTMSWSKRPWRSLKDRVAPQMISWSGCSIWKAHASKRG
jgi:hypothetical protein